MVGVLWSVGGNGFGGLREKDLLRIMDKVPTVPSWQGARMYACMVGDASVYMNGGN